jgi:hypothetical protein
VNHSRKFGVLKVNLVKQAGGMDEELEDGLPLLCSGIIRFEMLLIQLPQRSCQSKHL